MAAAANALARGGNSIPAGSNTTIYTTPASTVTRITEIILYCAHSAPVEVFLGMSGFQFFNETLQPKQWLPISMNTFLDAGGTLFINPSVANVVYYHVSGVADVNG